MTDAELIDAIRKTVLTWLKDPRRDPEETLVRIVELYEARGEGFFKADYPANEG